MRHRRIRAKLGRNSSHRKAMIRNMSASLLRHERISTTLAKAKEVRRSVDQLITLAKRDDLHARRQALDIIPDKTLVKKLFETLSPRYADRSGGYTRIYKMGYRRGDAAEMAVLELVDAEFEEVETKK